jgi:hypothetical protein
MSRVLAEAFQQAVTKTLHHPNINGGNTREDPGPV